jgi:hypothetical protein
MSEPIQTISSLEARTVLMKTKIMMNITLLTTAVKTVAATMS